MNIDRIARLADRASSTADRRVHKRAANVMAAAYRAQRAFAPPEPREPTGIPSGTLLRRLLKCLRQQARRAGL